MKKIKFDIQGMTCSSCSSHVEKAVKKLDGIRNVNVNLLSNNMSVEYDSNILNNEKIIKAVIEAGYGASISSNEENEKNKKIEKTKENLKLMKKRLIISICFLIPLMYIAMHHMFYKWFGLPIPQVVNNLFKGNENAFIFAKDTHFKL